MTCPELSRRPPSACSSSSRVTYCQRVSNSDTRTWVLRLDALQLVHLLEGLVTLLSLIAHQAASFLDELFTLKVHLVLELSDSLL